MREVAQIVKRRLFEATEESRFDNDTFGLMATRLLDVIRKHGIGYVERKRLQLLRLDEDADSVKAGVLDGMSPLERLDWQEIANRTIDVATGTADALINNTLREQQTINYVSSEQFKFDKWQFCIVTTGDNIKYIDFVFPDDERLKSRLIEYMAGEGFYYNDASAAFVEYLENLHQVNTNQEYYPTEEEIDVLSNWLFFRFFPYKPEELLQKLKKQTRYLIHLTPENNIESIKRTGIRPSNDSHHSYPERVCLIIPNRNDREDKYRIHSEFPLSIYINGLMTRLNSYRIEHRKSASTYKALIIDINKLPNDIGLYIDTPSYPYAVFKYNTVPADAVVRISETDDIISEFS